jgi:aldehyde:ferredoxin oxidoreductase
MASAAAAKKLGKGSEYLNTVGGVELPMHDPRLAPGFARTYQFDPTPARHVKGGLGMMQGMMPAGKYSYQATGFLDVVLTCGTEVTNASGLCMFNMVGAPQDAQPEAIAAVTGWRFKGQDQITAGLRSLDMRQAFNLREGLKPADFVLTPRPIGQPPQKEGPVAGVSIDVDQLGANLFAMVGWDRETGKPTLGSLKKLGLDDVARDLYGDKAADTDVEKAA